MYGVYFFANIDIGELLTPMFQKAPMLPMFDVHIGPTLIIMIII